MPEFPIHAVPTRTTAGERLVPSFDEAPGSAPLGTVIAPEGAMLITVRVNGARRLRLPAGTGFTGFYLAYQAVDAAKAGVLGLAWRPAERGSEVPA